ncbi:hypothetical protein ACMFMG_003853 [Clarireedia jacksonii]
MAEAVGLASSLLTLIIFAYDTSKSLYEAISSFKSQRQAIKDVLADLDSLVAVLTATREQAQRSQDIKTLEPLREPLTCCVKTCQEIREALDVCTTHSKDGHASVRDWLKMRYREKSFDDMKNRLASYKSTLIIAFQLINIQDHGTTQDSLRDLKDKISGTKEDLEDQLDQVQQTISTADASLREILQDDQARLQSSLDNITQAERVIENSPPKIIIERNRAGQGSRAIFGTDTSQPQFNLTVAENEAGIGAVVGAGVHSPETLQTLLGNSSTPNYALVLQALQTQSRSTSDSALQSILRTLSAKEDQDPTDKPPEKHVLTEPGTSGFGDGAGSSELPRRTVGSMHGNVGNDSKVREYSYQ